jgi:hypothetical protein
MWNRHAARDAGQERHAKKLRVVKRITLLLFSQRMAPARSDSSRAECDRHGGHPGFEPGTVPEGLRQQIRGSASPQGAATMRAPIYE